MSSPERASLRLPEALEERARWLGPPPAAPRWVLYWMRTAVRGHDNPALEAAVRLGDAFGLGVFCYHALSERYPYASDRHHHFILEGARDVAQQMEALGVGYAFHLERAGHRGSHLASLARDAGLVVTEDMPVPPLHAWTRSLQRNTGASVLLVDTVCVVPMKLTQRPERAFKYRDATKVLRAERLEGRWDRVAVPRRFVPQLPFEPVDLSRSSIRELVASCDIDHGVGPVADTLGGTQAGKKRWLRFEAEGLGRYAKDRNDPLKAGVSRMSAYLHYGFVSPFWLAKRAFAKGGAGADKFLDELLIWRELAHSFCFHERDLHSLTALPAWAQDTLKRHAHDPRVARLSWETLARGKTGDPLWDAAQRSLIRHGELHNNLRMTWGKAFLQWSASPAEALAMMIDLNHRYALDGQDPSSYGGLLWCLGLFDRPFEPGAPIRGTLRPRTCNDHAKRLDVNAFSAKVARPVFPGLGRVAVIGAGVAGLACARALHDHGVEVVVFDKGRRVGGRLSTRRQDGFQFDHGAQFLTAKDNGFLRLVKSWEQDGVVARWNPVTEPGEADGASQRLPRWVGQGSNRRIAEHLAQDLDVRLSVKVAPLERDGSLVDETGQHLGVFSNIVVTAPLAQASALLESHPTLVATLSQGAHAPCWALMVAFEAPLHTDLDVLFDRRDRLASKPAAIAWAARERSKPGRGDQVQWVVHASAPWSEAHLEVPPDEIERLLLAELEAELGRLPAVAFMKAHRWRYALVDPPLGVPFVAEGRVVVAGDGLLGPRLECAWQSGVAAAGEIVRRPGMPAEPSQGAGTRR